MLGKLHGATMETLMSYVPADVRSWAQATGEPVADRGRLSYEVATAYFKANPRVTRQLAAEVGLNVPARGAVSQATCEELAPLVR
jgi:hypothetical protein